MTYEKWKEQRGTSGNKTNDANYTNWLLSSGKVDINEIGEEINNRVNIWLQNNNNFIANYNDRIGAYQGKDPLDWAYEADSADWMSTITTQNNNFKAESESIKTILNQYKDYFSEDYVNAVTKALDGNLNVQGDVISKATEMNKYWSNFETEDAYNEYIASEKNYNEMLNYDLEAGKAKIDSYQNTIDNSITITETDRKVIYNIKKWLAEEKEKYSKAERIQNAVKLASVADVESENYDPEFEKYAQMGADIENPTADEAEGGVFIFGHRLGGDVEVGNIVTYSREYADEMAIGEVNGGGSSVGGRSIYGLMTENEVKTYNYYLAKYGKDKATEYLDSIEETLQTRKGIGMAEGVEGNLALEYMFASAAGLDQFATGVKSIFTDEYVPTSATQIASGIIREDLADTGATLPDWLGGSSVGQVGYDIINTGANMLPSILAGTAVGLINPVAGQVVGATLLGASAGGNAKAEMLRLGYSAEQANTYGIMVAIAEAGMEFALGSIPGISSGGGVFSTLGAKAATKIDNAISRVAIKLGNKGTSILRMAANSAIKVAGGALDEALEEGLQTIIEPWLKEIATGVDWDDPSIDEVLYSSLLGALTSVALGGIGDVSGEVNTYRAGNTIRKIDGGVGKLQEIATNENYFSADTVAYKIASKVDAFTDAYTIGKLISEVGGTISEQNYTDIVNGLVAKGMRKSDATKIAKQYQAFLNGEMSLSDEQVKIFENLSPLADVLRKNIIGANTTVYQRTRAYSDLMGLANDVANGKKGVSTPKSTRTNISEETKAEYERIASEVASGKRASASERFVKDIADSAKSAAEAKLGVEGKYTSTNTGANRLASDKKKVNIVGVDSISKDGTLKLKLDDGSVVDAEDINFSTSDMALVYEAVTNMGVNPTTAWEIIKGYDPKSGQSGTMYAMGALEAYTYGHNGVKVDGMSKDGFASLLSPVQKNTANRLGEIDAKAKVEAQQKTINKAVKSVRDEAKSKHKAIPKRQGGVVLEGEISRANLTDYQESQIDVLGKMAEGLGVTFHIFKSDEDFKYTMPDGSVRSANGWYDPQTGEIWIDLKAGDVGQGTIIFTAAHELTHFIKQWSPAKFKVFADFLMEQYGKGDKLETLIERRISDLKAHGRTNGLSATEIYDLAYEEIVADSCQTFLRDSKAAEKIAALREKDRSLANKIKTFLGQMLAKMRKILADNKINPDPHEAKIVSEMTDSIQKLYDLWTEALADAGEAYSTVGGEIDLDGDSNIHKLSDRTIIEGAGLQFIPDADGVHYQVLDAHGNAVESVTPEMIANSPLGQLVSSAKDNGFLGEGKMAESAAKKQYEFLAELVNMCINYDGLAPIWETAGTMVFSSIKSNADKQYGLTIDFSTVCKKTQAIVDAMSEAMVRLGRGLTRSEVETIYLEVGKAGESTPCPVCYVFSRWMGIGGILDQMSRFQDKYTNMSEGELQTFIADIKERISERANTPNKKGELKKDFFDKNGAIKEGQVIADLKQKANSGAGSTLNAITKNSDTQLQIQELKAMMENQDAKEAKKTATKIKKLEAKLVDVSALEKQFKEYNDAVEEYEAYQWLTRTLMEEVDGEWRKNKKFKPVPKDVLFDLNKGATFAEDYPLSWAFRTGKGASAGKAITPYADARVGEAIQGIASQDVKSIKTGIDLNPFLNGDEKTRQKIIASAIEKQAKQNLIGGQRYQSTSDFRYEYGSDYLITFLEMQAIGAKVQLYTKVIEAVDFLASMGADINLSVMPLSDGYVTLPNGKKKLIYSSVTGIDAEAAIKKAHEYNNVQLILVGISDEHIRLALEGEDVTFVIPFHGSGNSVHQIQALMNLLGENLDVTTAQDYTAVQSDHVSPKQTKEQKAMWDLRVKMLTGKASTLSASEFSILDKNAYLKDLYNRFYVNENADEFGINLSKDVAEQIFPYEYWDKSLTYAEADKNGERFKEYCASMGIIPRFSGMNSKGENVGFGDFTNNKGYWKLLIDRPMYDNTYDADGNWTGYGKYHEQKRINCSNFQVKHLDPEYGSATYGEVMSKANDPKKTNAIVDRAIAQFENAKFSDRDSHGNELSTEQQEYFKDSKVRDKKGNLMVLYHGTTANFNTFKKGDVGFHFGTKGAARGRVGFGKNVTLKEVYLNITNPIVFDEDLGSWDADYRLTRELYDKGILTQAEAESVLLTDNRQYRRTTEAANKKLASVLLEKGYDGIAYSNTFETKKPTTSYIIFNSNQAKDITNKTPTSNPDIRYSGRRDVEPIETADYVKMYHHFGSTKNYDVAGYILGNGVMLDFSGKHWGDDYSTSRQVDHRDIQEVLGSRGSNNGVNAMIDMIGNGNIRLMPEVGGINLAVKPNATQMSQLRGYINHFKGEVEIDIDEVGGDTIHSFRYTRGTSSAKVLADIKAYFDEGIVPKQKAEGETDIRQFLYSDRVADKKTLDFLENQEHVTVYRAMQVIDGKLYPPMNAYTKDQNGKKVLMPPSELGAWEQSVERPDLIDPKTGKFKLDKGKVDSGKRGSPVPAAYNPYIHTSLSMLNDQFTSAYQRSNLVVVKGIVPKSELTSGYRAQYAKDSVGETEWHSGVVSSQLAESRKVILSRWFKPVEILDNDTVAKSIKKMLSGTDIEIPYNVVSPGLRRSLENIGVPIGEGRGLRDLPKKDDVEYSDRSTHTRFLLANALETTAQNDIEKNKLAQYKGKIELIEQEQAKLKEIRAKIKDLSFAKGVRDTKAIKSLQFEANQIANRINTYDRQLLNLESTTALKNVLQREKKLAYEKAKKEGKDALAKYREKAAKTQRELMNRNTESRKKAIEGRNKTEMKHKIKKVVGDLKALLLNPTKDKHVPIGLQKSVAEALDVINMDTMGADERVAKYDAMIAKSNDPDTIAELTKTRDRIALQGANLSDKLTALKQAYADIKNSDDPLIRDSHNEAIEDLIANTVDKVGNTSLRDMSYEQLEAVYDMYKAVLATVRNANKMFKANMQETITDNSEKVKDEVRAAGGHRDRVLKATKFLKKFGWNMLKPVYAMKLIGSDTLTRLYENVRKGEDTWAVDVNEAKDFFRETAKKYEYNTWDLEKRYKFTDSVGHSFSLTLEQIMSLYAYSKRSQADKHLEIGGFIFDDAIEVKEKKHGITLTYEVNDANPYRLKKEDLGKIIDLVKTDMPNVKGFVDEMQAYLSDVMGAKGNEVSLAMYDIKLYKEQNYFPLKTAKYFREFDPEKNGTPKIKNSGFSKKTVPQAGNPIILSNFMDVWANHVNDMSMYHAFVLPLEDFMRVYNYSSTAGGYDSVQQYIKNAYGSQANTYIETLMNDLNGGARTDPATDLIGKGMSLFKKSAVFASASVVIQQPSAIARTLAYIDPKYFVDKPVPSKHSETWAEVKKYAPVAIIKEMGYFDTNMGRSTVDFIKSQEYAGIKEKFKAVFTDSDYRDEALSKAPALADELAWCAIWKAVKREVADTTNLTVGSEAFLKKAGERFTEAVTKTQVYDSVLSRSALMRSKDTGAKMVTAFMAEPTTSLNMTVDALIEGKRGNKKFAGRAIGAVAASIILNSILVSFVSAARDDDEDETYVEKYLESLTAELIDGFNPLTYIPLIKDIWSIAQGYDVERSDMSIWSDFFQSIENLFSDKKSGFEKVEGVVGAVSSFFGLPLKNLMRDARAMYNLAETLLSGTPTTWAGIGDAVGGSLKDSIPLYSRIEKWVGADESKSDKLYDAIVNGDQKQIDRVKAQYNDEDAIKSAIKQALRENDPRIKEAAKANSSGNIRGYSDYVNTIASEGHFDKETIESAIRAEQSAFNTKINKAAEAKNNGNDAEYKKIVRELRDSYRGIYSQDEIVNLITKAQNEQLETKDDDVEEATSIYKASDVNSAFESGDNDMALEVIDDLINTKVANGMTEKEAKSSIRSSMTSYWKPLYKAAYKSGNTAEKERIERILKASGLFGSASEVIKTCRGWRTERD